MISDGISLVFTFIGFMLGMFLMALGFNAKSFSLAASGIAFAILSILGAIMILDRFFG